MNRPINRIRESGSMTVEMTILAPVLFAFVLLVIFLGRFSQAGLQVRHAADQGARAASLVSRGRMTSVATSTALADLAANGVTCVNSSVSTAFGSFDGINTVTVTVQCSVDRSGLSLLGGGARTVTAASTEVVDIQRAQT